MASQPYMTAVVMPYLPLPKRVRVDGWRLIPRNQLRIRDAISREAAAHARGLLRLYTLTTGQRSLTPVGGFAVPPEGKMGDRVTGAQVERLHLALVAALLAENPEASSDNPNAGHSAASSDLATVYGQPITPDGYFAISEGAMVRSLVGGLRVGERESRMPAPVEVHVPLMRFAVDFEYASAVHELLGGDDDEARRLGRSIEWLDLVWRNTRSITEDTRIVGLRMGFEVLLDAGDQEWGQRAALSALLDPKDVARPTRELPRRQGPPAPTPLSDLEWWYSTFCRLRNAIVHGRAIPREDYLYDGTHQINLAETWLRRAVKQKLINAGFSDLAYEPGRRARYRAARRAIADYTHGAPG